MGHPVDRWLPTVTGSVARATLATARTAFHSRRRRAVALAHFQCPLGRPLPPALHLARIHRVDTRHQVDTRHRVDTRHQARVATLPRRQALGEVAALFPSHRLFHHQWPPLSHWCRLYRPVA